MITKERVAQLKPGDQVNWGGDKGLFTIDSRDLKYIYGHFGNHPQGRWDHFYPTAFEGATEDLTAQFCAYCGKELKQGEWTEFTIWHNGSRVTAPYCNLHCANCAEMSGEG